MVFFLGGGGGRGGVVRVLNMLGLRVFVGFSFWFFVGSGESRVGGWISSIMYLFLVNSDWVFGSWISVSFYWKF